MFHPSGRDRRTSVIATRLKRDMTRSRGPGTKAQHGQKAQTLTLCASTTDRPCTTGEFETLPTHHGTGREWSARRTPRRGNYSPRSPAIHRLRRHHGVGRAPGTTDICAQGEWEDAGRGSAVGVQGREGSGGGPLGNGKHDGARAESKKSPAKAPRRVSTGGWRPVPGPETSPATSHWVPRPRAGRSPGLETAARLRSDRAALIDR